MSDYKTERDLAAQKFEKHTALHPRIETEAFCEGADWCLTSSVVRDAMNLLEFYAEDFCVKNCGQRISSIDLGGMCISGKCKEARTILKAYESAVAQLRVEK